MSHGGRDRASVLACFDAVAAPVFASLCHLTAGDHRRAQTLLVRTFTVFIPPPSSAYETSGGTLDRRSMIIAAHRCFLANDQTGGAEEGGPVAELIPTERAVLNLMVAEHMTSPQINFALRMAENEADRIAASASRHITESAYGRPLDEVLTSCEVWFDDAMRDRCRIDVDESLSARPPTTDADGIIVQTRRSRWITVGGSIAATAIAAVAIGAWLAPSPDNAARHSADLGATTTADSGRVSKKDPSELPDPATASPTTIPGSAATTVEPGFILDAPPLGHVRTSANSESASTPNWLDVWATPSATRTGGRWFAISIAAGLESPVFPNATRSTIAGHPTLTTVDATGVTYAIQQRSPSHTVRFEIFGFGNDDVRQILLATSLTGDGTVARTPLFEAVVHGLELVWSGRTGETGFPTGVGGAGRRTAIYQTADGADEIDVVTVAQAVNDLDVTRLLTPAPSPADSFVPQRMVVLNNGGALVGDLQSSPDTPDLSGRPDRLFAQFHDGTQTVTVIGRLPIRDLTQIARSAHLASAEQWSGLSSEAIELPAAAQDSYAYTTVGGNVTDLGEAWVVGVVNISCPAITFENIQAGRPASTDPLRMAGPRFCLTPDPAQPLVEFATYDTTLVAVVFATPTSATAMRVISAGGVFLDVPLTLSDDPAWSAAGYAFTETGPYSVMLVDADGKILEELAPLP